MLRRLLFILCVLLLAVGVVSAADNNTTDSLAIPAEVNVQGSDDWSIGIDAADSGFNDDVEEVTYKFRVVNSSSGSGVSGASFSFDGDPNSFSKSGYSDDYGYCTVRFAPGFITSGSALINVWYGDLHEFKVVNFKVNHIGSKSADVTGVSDGKVVSKSSGKLKVSAPVVKVTQGSKSYFKVTVKKGTTPVKNLKFKVKVWTGKKVKVYTVKTNKNGVAKLSTKKLKVGSHKVKIISKSKKYKFSKVSKIKVVRKSNLKHFTLEVRYSSFYPAKKKIGKDVVYAWFETDYGRQSLPGVYVEANYLPDGRSLPKHIKLVKGYFYFDAYGGDVHVTKVKATGKGSIECKLYKDYTPRKVVVYYKKV